MRLLLDATLMTGPWREPLSTGADFDRTANPADAGREGMARRGRVLVRAQSAREAARAARDFYHGAFRMSRDGVKALLHGKRLFENRDSMMDYGEGAMILDCPEDAGEAVREAVILARCEGYARMLGNLPNNLLRIDSMAEYLTDMAADCGLKSSILQGDEIADCGGILAVNRGASQGAALAVLSNHDETPELALVGKGVMFDAGGYHLKDISGMDGMKGDMLGAAVVAEALEWSARMGVKTRLSAVMPLVENVISPDAVKMGDVISTLSGKTVEVYNTDAEGRLILCDALTYACRLGAKRVTDIATLTCGCQTALGDEVGGLFVSDEAALERARSAMALSGELFWPLPMMECYENALKWSQVADLANYAPGKHAAASMAACFLKNFVNQDVQWIHLDVVGPSTRRGSSETECPGARGFGLATLMEMIKN